MPLVLSLIQTNGTCRPAGACSFLAKFQAHASEYPPEQSIVCAKGHLVRNPSERTVLELSRDYYVNRFREVRNGKTLDGDHFVRAGIDYIRRGDYLFDALSIYKRNKVVCAGEYRLTTAYQYMWHHGESFGITMVDPLHCGSVEGLETAEQYYECHEYMDTQWKHKEM